MGRFVNVGMFGLSNSVDVVGRYAIETKEVRLQDPEREEQVQALLDSIPAHCKLPKPRNRVMIRRYIP